MTSRRNYFIGSVVAGGLVGLAFGNMSIFANMFLFMAMFGFGILCGISYLFSRGDTKVAFSLGCVFTVFFIGFLGSIATIFIRNKLNTAEGNDLITKIEQYKTTNGHYPATLSAVDGEHTPNEKFYYFTDSTKSFFRLSFGVDGWHLNEWDSNEKQWQTVD